MTREIINYLKQGRCTYDVCTRERVFVAPCGHHHDSNQNVGTGWFRLNAKNCVPGNSSRRFFELDHEILHTYSGRQYLKLEEGGFLIWGFAVEISGF